MEPFGNPIITHKFTTDPSVLSFIRGTSSPGPPYTLARGGPAPRSARVARSRSSLAL